MTEQTNHTPSTQSFVDEWMTPKEVCRELQIPEQTFYQWRVKHAGPRAHRIGRHLRISRTDFNAWLATTEDPVV
ncbi:helix-turn-helix domain-containing protein [Arthrobacter sp. A2-55]|uniref:helix-turn-helix domain-containing protein n=1 Tax=Arthrobacter sp. A2-55 TaxID=2897337 RepID=UPI0021CDB390|nr:helix-turn-helix domain-containing protein [Arthrobacter sp. A2-55]MCU6480608.1 helix-turn-helix domain-containing protein [Arthrobacter sp. A2-55]